eukprot:scaffold781_cov394-Prasinococcus_capsulatus_cf.AAC.11
MVVSSSFARRVPRRPCWRRARARPRNALRRLRSAQGTLGVAPGAIAQRTPARRARWVRGTLVVVYQAAQVIRGRGGAVVTEPWSVSGLYLREVLPPSLTNSSGSLLALSCLALMAACTPVALLRSDGPVCCPKADGGVWPCDCPPPPLCR